MHTRTTERLSLAGFLALSAAVAAGMLVVNGSTAVMQAGAPFLPAALTAIVVIHGAALTSIGGVWLWEKIQTRANTEQADSDTE